MTNTEIASRFTRIADILEIQGENAFKIRAYRNAAETILDLEEPLAELDARGMLPELPGFGEAIVSKTQDFLNSGTTALYERIKDSVPDGVVRMARIPGLSPKTVQQLWQSLSITDADMLETAAREGKVRTLVGFGAAKESKLIENIERWRRLTATVPLYVARTQAERIARTLRGFPGVRAVEICGEIRRGCETVRAIYLLADTAKSADTLAGVDSLPDVTRRLESSSAHVVVELASGLHLTVATYDAALRWSAWGFAMLAATGPATFYDSLEPGDSLNKVSLATEEDVFAALELPYIPPEIRDTEGVLEKVRQEGVPPLIRTEDIRGQLHEHSRGSDGTASVREMAEAALKRGYEYIAITDHSPSLRIANGQTRDRLLAQIEEIEELNREFVPRGLTILSGIEADILPDGSVDCDDDVLLKLDVVVASIHMRYKEDADAMTARMVKAIENKYVHIIGHPTGRLLGRREAYPLHIDAVIAAAARTGTILEINASPERLDLSDEHARLAKEMDVPITINADAHSTGGLDLVEWGVTSARRAWLTSGHVINTFPLEKLRELLGRKRASNG